MFILRAGKWLQRLCHKFTCNMVVWGKNAVEGDVVIRVSGWCPRRKAAKLDPQPKHNDKKTSNVRLFSSRHNG